MSKTQKIWLTIFLAMFIIPELLWSPVGNYIYELSKIGGNISTLRSNFITSGTEYGFIWYGFITLLQLVGITGALVCLLMAKKKYPKNQVIFYIVIFLSIICFALTALTFYLVTFVGANFP